MREELNKLKEWLDSYYKEESRLIIHRGVKSAAIAFTNTSYAEIFMKETEKLQKRDSPRTREFERLTFTRKENIVKVS